MGKSIDGQLRDLFEQPANPNEKTDVKWVKVADKLPNHETYVVFVNRYGYIEVGMFYAYGDENNYIDFEDYKQPFFVGTNDYLPVDDVIFWVDLKLPEYDYDEIDTGGFTH